MKKTYQETKDYLIDKLIEDVSSEKSIRECIESFSLTFQEGIFNLISLTCKYLYSKKPLPQVLLNSLEDYGIKELYNGWFLVNNQSYQGRFINANAIFKDVFCKSKECHKAAYNFIIDFKQNDMFLRSGTIKPYRTGQPILHSICTFTNDEKEYVFDGSHAVLMEKNLYYAIFDFQEQQVLSRRAILHDRKCFIKTSPLLKTTKKYSLTQDHENLTRSFSGMGFVIYLYNREAIMNSLKNITDLEKQNQEAVQVLNERLKNAYGESVDKF